MTPSQDHFKILSQCAEVIERINPDFMPTRVGIPFHGVGVHFHGEEDSEIFFHVRQADDHHGGSTDKFLVQGFVLSEDKGEQCMMYGGVYRITGDGYSMIDGDELPPLDPVQREAEGVWE